MTISMFTAFAVPAGAEEALTVTTPPTGKTALVYNGGEQDLLETQGEASTGGKMQYSTDYQAPDQGTWKDDAKGTDAGEYKVYYKAVPIDEGGEYTESTVGEPITVNIAKKQEDTPNIQINYTDETLTGFDSGASYSITGSDISETVSSTETTSAETYMGKGELSIVRKAQNETNYTDSEAYTLSVPARPATPTAKAENPTTISGKGKITGVDSTMEYQKSEPDAGSWTAVEGNTIDELDPGTYKIRVKATPSGFVSAEQTLTITAFTGTQETKPNITIDYVNEKLTGFVEGGEYTAKIKDGGAEAASLEIAGQQADIKAEWFGKTLEIVKKGDNKTTIDSEAYTLSVPARPTAPDVTGTAPTTHNGNGKITGFSIGKSYEYSSSSASGPWTSVGASSTEIELASGTYYVREKAAANTSFASEAKQVEVPAFEAQEISGTVTISGTATFGETLTADVTGVMPAEARDTLKYQWQRSNDGSDYTNIDTATDKTYKITADDIDKTIKVVVTAGDEDYSGSLTSEATSTVEKATITGIQVNKNTDIKPYTGEAQTLVTVTGNQPEDKITYNVVKKSESNDSFTDKAEATNAGTYAVKVKVQREGYNDYTSPEAVEVTIEKAESTITQIPTKKDNLTYNSTPQALVNAGTATGGTLKYSTNNVAWNTEVPQGTDAETYQVWYKVEENDNYKGIEAAGPIDVTIKKATPNVTAPTPKELTYTGAEQELINKGTTDGGIMKYSTTSAEAEDYSDVIPKGTEAAEYTVWYKVEGGKNYTDVAAQSVKATIKAAAATVDTPPTAASGLKYTGIEQELLTDKGKATGGKMVFSLTEEGDYTEDIPKGKEAQKYTVYYKAQANENYTDSDVKNIEVTIDRAQAEFPSVPTVEGGVYTDGMTLSKVTVPEVDGGTIAWKDAETTALKAGENSVDAIFTPSDTANYEGTPEGKVTVNITPATITGVVVNGVTAQYDENEANKEYTLAPPTGTRETDEVRYAAGSYSAETDDTAEWLEECPKYKDENTNQTITVRVKRENYTTLYRTAIIKITNEPVIEDVTVTNKEGLTYTGQELDLVEVSGLRENDQVTYYVNEDTVGTATAKGKDAGNYTVKVKVEREGYHTHEYTVHTVIAKAKPTITAQANQTAKYTGSPLKPTVSINGELELKYAVTSPDDASYENMVKVGVYEITVSAEGDKNHDTPESVNIKFTITEAEPSVKAPSAARGLVYDGNPKTLVTGGSATGGTMMYRVGTEGDFSTKVPQETNAGTYDVYYKVEGDENYSDIEPGAPITVTIAKAALTAADVVITGDGNITHDGEAHGLTVTLGGKAENGAVKYADGTFTAANDTAAAWQDASPTVTNVNDTKTITVKVSKDNYNDYYVTKTITITDEPTVSDITVTPYGGAYDGEFHNAVTVNGQLAGDTVTYQLGDAEATAFVPQVKEAGAYSVKVSVSRMGHHPYETTVTVTITKAESIFPNVSAAEAVYTEGMTLEDVKLPETEGGTLAWKVPSTAVTEGTAEYDAVFTPTDTNNYEPVEGKITVTATPIQTAEPTAEPTTEPTEAPTLEPTSEPTAEPTSEPTEEPTTEPTSEPTEVPTATPTVTPTVTPTQEPTATPTQEPTATPTSEPTEAPTSEPTATPMPEPTAASTLEPTVTSEPTSAPKPAYDVTVTVENPDGSAASDLTITLKPGDKTAQKTQTDGEYVFSGVEAGAYNIVVETSDGQTVTSLVEITDNETIKVTLPPQNVSNTVETVESDEESEVSVKDVIVGGLDKLAEAIAEESGGEQVEVEVKMTVESKKEDKSDAIQQAIKEKAAESKINYIDIDIVKTVTTKSETTAEKVEETNSLITIIIPFVTSDKDNIKVYRYHDNEASLMDKDGTGERYEVGDGVIRIYTSKFSTYAIAYDEKSDATPEPAPEVTPEPTPEATPEATPEPTPEVTAAPTAKPSSHGGGGFKPSGSNAAPAPTPTAEPTTAPTAEPESTAASTAAPETEPTAAPEATPTAEPTTVPAEKIFPFTDVQPSDWFYSAVKSVYEAGLISGVSDSEFAPDMTLTRGMLATILGRMDGAPTTGTSSFSDVNANEYYAPYIAWGTEIGILNGIGDNKFAPDDEVTREQTAAMLWRYEQYKGHDVSIGDNTNILSYKDAAEVSEYALPALQWACGAGVVNGYPDGTLAPKASITRAEFAAVINKIK